MGENMANEKSKKTTTSKTKKTTGTTPKKSTKTTKASTTKAKAAATKAKKATTKVAASRKVTAQKVAKEASKKASGAWDYTVDFFKNLNKAYYVGALAVLSMLLFFSAWIEIPMITDFGKFLNLPAINGSIPIPQALMSLCTGVDDQMLNISNLLNYLDVSSINADQINQIYQTIKSVASMAGINVADWTFNVSDFVASVKEAFPDPNTIYDIKHILAQVSGIAKIGSFAVAFICLLVVGFNLYTAILAFWKKKVNKVCMVGFIVEIILVALVIIGCNILNGFVSSKIFIINTVCVPTFWAWLSLIVCIVAIVAINKITKKAGEKFNKKRFGVVVGVIAAVILVICILVGIDNNNKKQPYIGNWNIADIEKDNSFDEAQIKQLQEKGVDFSKSVVVTVKSDFTFEESLFGHLVKGTYEVVPEGISLNPDFKVDSDFAKIILKQDGDKLTANLGCFEIAKLSKFDMDAKSVSDEIKYSVGMAALDYALNFVGIKDMTAQDVVNAFNGLKESIVMLSEVDRDQLMSQIKQNLADEIREAYNKLDANQKKAVDEVYQLIISAKTL